MEFGFEILDSDESGHKSVSLGVFAVRRNHNLKDIPRANHPGVSGIVQNWR
jgi:hypothetical protein